MRGERRVGASESGERQGELASRLHSLAIHLLRWVRREDVETGLGPARLSALSVLVFGGARNLGQLAAVEQVSAPTMSRIVKALEEEGLVRRDRDPSDGRGVVVTATRSGRAVLEAGRARRVARVAELLAELDPAALESVANAVAAVESALSSRRS